LRLSWDAGSRRSGEDYKHISLYVMGAFALTVLGRNGALERALKYFRIRNAATN
jgi:hypothetical protein